MQRRAFLQATVGAGAGAVVGTMQRSAAREERAARLSRYGETRGALADLDLLGIRRSWRQVHQGLYPFSPERTVIVSERPQDNGCGRPQEDVGKVVRRIREDLDKDETRHTEDGVLQIVHAACRLTQAYCVPEQWEDWSRRMASWLFRFYPFCAEDHLWISPLGWSSARETVPTMNGVVDWWLLLSPGGIEIRNWDGTRVHVLMTPVLAGDPMPRVYGDFWDLMAKAVRFPAKWGAEKVAADSTWRQVARRDRQQACRFINERIARTLAG